MRREEHAMIYLVRHADAGLKREWDRPDELRPLTPTGWLEARALLARLLAEPVDAVISSPAVRCRQTVEELAERRRLPLRIDRRLGVRADVTQAATLVCAAGSTDTVLCTHGEVIGRLLSLLRERGAPISRNAKWAKGSAWILDTVGGRVRDAIYLRPPYPIEV
jgi:broad specificity phosphatase PhoE